MSFLSDLYNPVDAISDTYNLAATLPGSPEASFQGLYGGLNGDLSWNPYSQDNSVWDTGAGGTSLSQDPTNRRYGRMIGTAVGAAFGGGALAGAAGGGAGTGASIGAEGTAGSSALGIGAGTEATSGAAELSLGSQAGIDAASATGAGTGTLASNAQNGAIRGSVQGAANAQANGTDPFKGGLYGGLYGGIGGGVNYELNSSNPGAYATDNQDGQKIINKGISGGVNAGLQGKSVTQGALMGAGGQGVNMLGGMWGNQAQQPDYSLASGNGSNMDYGDGQQNPLKPFVNGSASGYSLDNGMGTQTPGASLGYQGLPTTTPNIGGAPAPQTGGTGTQPANMMSNLMGLYSAYKQHQANSQLQGNLSSMYGQDSPYAQQLKQQLARTAAQSGRRSDAGSQVVALQAALAHGNSQNAPQIMSLNNQNTNGMNAGLNNLYQIGQQTGANQQLLNGGKDLWNQGSSYLSNMFGG